VEPTSRDLPHVSFATVTAGNGSGVPLLQRGVETAFAALATVRAARAFHPTGALVRARLLLTDAASPAVRALGGPDERPALVRVSKGAGTPGGLPDLLGVAVRVDTAAGPVDLLFTTVAPVRGVRVVLAPATGWGTLPYSTLLPYRADDGTRVTLGLEAEDPTRARGADPQRLAAAVGAEPVGFRLVEKRAGADWSPVGRLVLEEPLPEQDRVAFDPVVNAHPRLRPVSFLADVRAWAYAGSRRGWGAERAALDRTPAPSALPRVTPELPAGLRPVR